MASDDADERDRPAPVDPDVVAGRAVRERRLELGLTQRDLADKLAQGGWAIDATAVAKIEAGRRSLRVSQIYDLSEALDTSPSIFFVDEVNQISELRFNATRGLQAARRNLVKALGDLEQVWQRTRLDPELLAETTSTGDLQPDTYLETVLNRVRVWVRTEDADREVISDNVDLDTLSAIARELVTDLFVLVDADGNRVSPERAPGGMDEQGRSVAWFA